MTVKPAKPGYKRSQYWVDAPLQVQMVGYVLVMIAASLALTAFSVWRGVQEASAISLLAGGLLTLFWSHRFAGPLRVISAGVARVRHGNLAVPVRVRSTDAHRDLAAEFQHMQDALRAMIEADRARIKAAVASLESAEEALEQGREAEADIAAALKELKHACTQYHL
jgi:methyl-accepting chemotaxis protein